MTTQDSIREFTEHWVALKEDRDEQYIDRCESPNSMKIQEKLNVTG